MKIDVTPVMTTYNGTPITEQTADGKTEALTLKEVICRALARPEQNLDWKEEVRRDDLCREVYAAEKTVDLNAEDVTLIKGLISKFGWSPAVSGAAHKLIDPKPKLVDKATN